MGLNGSKILGNNFLNLATTAPENLGLLLTAGASKIGRNLKGSFGHVPDQHFELRNSSPEYTELP